MAKALLHLVFGGEVRDPAGVDFVDAGALDVVGIYPNYKKALEAWRGASQAHVDEANVKYVIVHLHRLLDPDQESGGKAAAGKAGKGSKAGARRGSRSR